LEQALLLQAGRVIDGKVRSDKGLAARLAASKMGNDQLADLLFLGTLSRYPSASERQFTVGRLAVSDRRQALEDVLWMLLNHREFVFQH
jgi:hypothetical protein